MVGGRRGKIKKSRNKKKTNYNKKTSKVYQNKKKRVKGELSPIQGPDFIESS